MKTIDDMLAEMEKINKEWDELMMGPDEVSFHAPAAPPPPPFAYGPRPPMWDSILRDNIKKKNEEVLKGVKTKTPPASNWIDPKVNKLLYTKQNNVIYPLVWMSKPKS